MATNKDALKWYQVDRGMLASKIAFIFAYGKESCYIFFIVLFFTSLGLTKTQAGVVSGLRSVGSMVGGPFWGMVADSRKAHLKVTLATGTAAALLQASQPIVAYFFNRFHVTNSVLFSTLLVINILAMFFDASLMSFTDVSVIQAIKTSTRKPDFGFQRLYGSPGFGVVMLLSSLLLSAVPDIAYMFRYSVTFIVYFACVVSLCFTLAFMDREYKDKLPTSETKTSPTAETPQTEESAPSPAIALWNETKKPMTVFFLVTLFLFGVARGFYASYNYVLLKELQAPNRYVTYCIIASSISVSLVLGVSSRISQVLKSRWISMCVSMGFWAVHMLWLHLARTSWLIVVSQVLLGPAFGLTTDTRQGELTDANSHQHVFDQQHALLSRRQRAGQRAGRRAPSTLRLARCLPRLKLTLLSLLLAIYACSRCINNRNSNNREAEPKESMNLE